MLCTQQTDAYFAHLIITSEFGHQVTALVSLVYQAKAKSSSFLRPLTCPWNAVLLTNKQFLKRLYIPRSQALMLLFPKPMGWVWEIWKSGQHFLPHLKQVRRRNLPLSSSAFPKQDHSFVTHLCSRTFSSLGTFPFSIPRCTPTQ